MSGVTPDFGDNVRIRTTPLTERLGLAGLTGNVYGFTTPSATDVNVIGEATDDFALSVMLDARREQLWFAPQLVEFVDHAPGSELRVGDVRLIRRADGGWDRFPSLTRPAKQGFIARLMGVLRRRG